MEFLLKKSDCKQKLTLTHNRNRDQKYIAERRKESSDFATIINVSYQ